MEFIYGDERRFIEFISNITDKDKVGIVSHTDCDGVGAAIIISKVVGKVDSIHLIGYNPETMDCVLKEMKDKKINKIIFSDLFFDDFEKAKELEKFAEVLFIDHHPSENNLNSQRVVYIKAESKYPASYLCYYLFSKIQKIPSWIAAMGIISDLPNKYNQENCNEVYKDFRMEKSSGDLWKVYEDAAFALAALRNEEKKIYDVLMNAKNLDDIDFSKYTKGIKKEFEEKIIEFEEEKEVYGSLIFYYIGSKYSIKALLINGLSSKYPNNTLVFVSNKDIKSDFLNVSSRRQDRQVDCNLLMKTAINNIPNSNGGGHKAAAGAMIPRERLKSFKENLIRIHKGFDKNQ